MYYRYYPFGVNILVTFVMILLRKMRRAKKNKKYKWCAQVANLRTQVSIWCARATNLSAQVMELVSTSY